MEMRNPEVETVLGLSLVAIMGSIGLIRMGRIGIFILISLCVLIFSIYVTYCVSKELRNLCKYIIRRQELKNVPLHLRESISKIGVFEGGGRSLKEYREVFRGNVDYILKRNAEHNQSARPTRHVTQEDFQNSARETLRILNENAENTDPVQHVTDNRFRERVNTALRNSIRERDTQAKTANYSAPMVINNNPTKKRKVLKSK